MTKLDIAMTDEERAEYLAEQRTMRLATVGEDGEPQVIPLWFAWVGGVMFFNTTLGNLSVRNIEANGRAASTVDDGDSYEQLRGIVVRGRAARVEPDDEVLDAVKREHGRKYFAGALPPYDAWRNRSWFRLDPAETTSWDFRKIPEAKERRRREREGGA
jgi:PPOX class probable F420-dependent enzyme